MLVRLLAVALLVSGWASSQQERSSPEFEVASVRRVEPGTRIPLIGSNGGPGTNQPETYECDYCPLKTFVEKAFDLKSFQVVLPEGLSGEHYMLRAKLAPASTAGDFRRMMLKLLQDRFALSYHMVSKEMTGYVLGVAKGGVKARIAVPEDVSDAGKAAQPLPMRDGLPDFKMDADGFPVMPGARGPVLYSDGASSRLVWGGATMPELAGRISIQMAAPVTDETGLRDRYDIRLRWSGDGLSGRAASAESEWPHLIDALRSQLGLTLERKSVSVQTVVVDHIERTPTDD
jgi:uncharacterized protein (TIGR03435 family)